MIAGICGGLAEYFDLDVSIIRILWVIGTLLSAGVGILVYIVMLIVFPEQPIEVDDKKVSSLGIGGYNAKAILDSDYFNNDWCFTSSISNGSAGFLQV